MRAASSGVVHVNSGGAVVHRNSCNSHAARVRGGTAAMSTSARCKDWRPAVGKLGFLQQASGRMHGEAWARSFAVPLSCDFHGAGNPTRVCCHVPRLPTPFFPPEPPGPSREVRSWIGRTPLEKTSRSGVWLFRGALMGERVFSAFSAAGDWVKKGSYHTAWSSCSCVMCILVARHSYRAKNCRAVLVTAYCSVEGYRTRDEAVVC